MVTNWPTARTAMRLMQYAIDVVEQKQHDDEPGLDPGLACIVIERGMPLSIPVAMDRAGELH